jgi:hypothetical protein
MQMRLGMTTAVSSEHRTRIMQQHRKTMLDDVKQMD